MCLKNRLILSNRINLFRYKRSVEKKTSLLFLVLMNSKTLLINGFIKINNNSLTLHSSITSFCSRLSNIVDIEHQYSILLLPLIKTTSPANNHFVRLTLFRHKVTFLENLLNTKLVNHYSNIFLSPLPLLLRSNFKELITC